MSARVCGTYVRSVISLTTVLISVTTASAFDLAAPFTDPLHVIPPVLESGVTLPGDAAALSCPSTVDVSLPLTLPTAVDTALCTNSQIKAAWSGIKVQAAAVGEARAAYLPTISGTINHLYSETDYHEMGTTSSTGFTLYGALNWKLFDFGGRRENRYAANSLLTAALAAYDGTLQKTVAEVVRGYFDAQTAKATLESKTENERVAADILKTAQRREARGAGSVGDTLQAAAAQSRAALEKSRAQGGYVKALTVMVFLMGLPAQSRITLADELHDGGDSSGRELDEWLAIAKSTHPEIVAARAQLDAARSKLQSVRSEGLPSMDFNANYYQNGYPGQGMSSTESSTYTIGAQLSVPIFDGFARTYKIRGAEAQVEQREIELHNTEQTVLTELVKSYADAAAALQNLQFSETLVRTAQAALANSQRKFEKGAADILEILNAKTVMSDARQERIRCRGEWQESRLRLLANTGQLNRSHIKLTNQRPQ